MRIAIAICIGKALLTAESKLLHDSCQSSTFQSRGRTNNSGNMRTEIASVEDQHTAYIEAPEDPVLELSRLIGITRLTQDTGAYLVNQVKISYH